jgi:hypothetical protein
MNNPTNYIDPFGFDTSKPVQLKPVTITGNQPANNNSNNFWWIRGPVYGGGLLSLPVPKNLFGPVLPNSSKYTTTLSGLLGKWKTPINILGKKRLYTHTVNGSRRYASTYGRFLGRWGSRIFGRASAILMYMDVGNTTYKFYNEQFTKMPVQAQFRFVNTQMMSGSSSAGILSR